MDVLTEQQRHKNMKNIHAKDTAPEVQLRKALWACGLRYRKNDKSLPGQPDIVLRRYNIAIFCDGDFWHARGHEENPGEQVERNHDFWVKKLTGNVRRDTEVNELLTEQGWLVLRFWEGDIKKDLAGCVKKVLAYTP